ncbi:MAG: pseudouridine synthase [Moraxellaceae bacterium]|nr:MAG: pseudouridine synthase [Moraxellaceae bacterium]
MHSKRTRLDRFVSQNMGINRKDVRAILARGRLILDGQAAVDIHQQVDEFSQVILDGITLQNKQPVYLMLNKPVGVVSATKDSKHKTVIDVVKTSLNEADIQALDIDNIHLAGRLDFNSSGLLLLTNDGRWSRRLSLPEEKIAKLYRVTLANKITADYQQTFAEGMYFSYENIITRPAKLEIINEYTAMVTLVEGRYHQIKRMFGRFQNPVLQLHRVAIGKLTLDVSDGQWRQLTAAEIEV